GEDATVNLNSGQVHALDEAVVRHAVLSRRSVDALNPQATEVAFARATVTVRVDERVGDLLFRLAVEARALTTVTGCALEDNPTLLVGVDRPLYSCHFLFFLTSGGLATEKLVDGLDVGLGDRLVPVEAALALAR